MDEHLRNTLDDRQNTHISQVILFMADKNDGESTVILEEETGGNTLEKVKHFTGKLGENKQYTGGMVAS